MKLSSLQITINKDIKTPKRSSPPPKANIDWSELSDAEEEDKDIRTYTPLQEDGDHPDVESESGSSVKETPAEETKQVLPTLLCRPSLGQEASFVSNQSDTTLEFHDAPSPKDLIETQRQVADGVDREVTVKIPKTLEEDHIRAELSPVAEFDTDAINVTREDLPSGQSLLNTQEAQEESLELKVHADVENDLVKNVTEEQWQETSDTDVHKQHEVMEAELEVPSRQLTLELLPAASEGPAVEEPTEAEKSIESCIVLEEGAASNTIEEPAIEESELVSHEPVTETSVVWEVPANVLESHEPVADADVNAHITAEPEESMETSGANLSRTLNVNVLIIILCFIPVIVLCNVKRFFDVNICP